MTPVIEVPVTEGAQPSLGLTTPGVAALVRLIEREPGIMVIELCEAAGNENVWAGFMWLREKEYIERCGRGWRLA